MRANMDASGVITITAETDVEAYALRHWSEQNAVHVNDVMRAEQLYWRGSRLIIRGDLGSSSVAAREAA